MQSLDAILVPPYINLSSDDIERLLHAETSTLIIENSDLFNPHHTLLKNYGD